MKKSIKIGLLFGSFNPIHIGHLLIANYITEFNLIDEIWFVVTPQNPLKNPEALINASHRLTMTELAIKPYAKFRTCAIEFSLPQPTYTIRTLDALQEKYPAYDFHLLIGSDNWQQLPGWKDYERLYTDYKIIIYPRHGTEVQLPTEKYPNILISDAPRVEISSSFIRSALKEQRIIDCFMPMTVYEYIIANKLYEITI